MPKCRICGNEFEIRDLYCMGHGLANTDCNEEHCILMCSNCSLEFIDVYRTGIEFLRKRYERELRIAKANYKRDQLFLQVMKEISESVLNSLAEHSVFLRKLTHSR